jgi:ABC-type enterochelin transport system permease subunit
MILEETLKANIMAWIALTFIMYDTKTLRAIAIHADGAKQNPILSISHLPRRLAAVLATRSYRQ